MDASQPMRMTLFDANTNSITAKENAITALDGRITTNENAIGDLETLTDFLDGRVQRRVVGLQYQGSHPFFFAVLTPSFCV